MLFSLARTGQMWKCAASKATSPWTIVFSKVWIKNLSLQYGLGTVSSSCVVSHSQTACAWWKPSGYMRVAISCLEGRKKHSTRKGYKNYFLNAERKMSWVLVHCVMVKTEIRPFESQTIVWTATITTITWAFYSSYSSIGCCMEWIKINSCTMHYGIHLQQTYCLLSDTHGEVHKVMNIKDVFWSVIMNMCIRLDNDWTQK